jgi:hypothetical protein
MACKNAVMCFTQHFLSVLFWQPQSSSWILMILQAHPGKLFFVEEDFWCECCQNSDYLFRQQVMPVAGCHFLETEKQPADPGFGIATVVDLG